MNDEPNIIHSPLGRKVSKDDTTVEVLIYRGEDEDGWILEVVDEEDGSTVWNEPFPTDQAALDEFERIVAEQGIRTFLEDDAEPTH